MQPTLIEDIKSDVLDYRAPLSAALMKSLVLASKLGSEVLRRWATDELHGYQGSNLPTYRIPKVLVRASATNGAWINRDVVLNLQPFGEDNTNMLQKAYIRESVSALEQFKEQAKTAKKEMRVMLPAQMYPLISAFSLGGYECYEAYQVIPNGTFSTILEAVRFRLLDYAIKLEEAYPEAQDFAALGRDQKTLSQIFNGCIMNPGSGSSHIITDNHGSVIATDSAKVNNATASYTVTEAESFHSALESLKQHIAEVSNDQRQEVTAAIDLLITALDDFAVPKSRVMAAVETIAEKSGAMGTQLKTLAGMALAKGAEKLGELNVQHALDYFFGTKS